MEENQRNTQLFLMPSAIVSTGNFRKRDLVFWREQTQVSVRPTQTLNPQSYSSTEGLPYSLGPKAGYEQSHEFLG